MELAPSASGAPPPLLADFSNQAAHRGAEPDGLVLFVVGAAIADSEGFEETDHRTRNRKVDGTFVGETIVVEDRPLEESQTLNGEKSTVEEALFDVEKTLEEIKTVEANTNE